MPMTPYALIPHAVGQQRPQLFLAQVSASKPAPSSLTDPLYVVEPSRPNVSLTIPEFPAVHGDTLPAAGATCVIQRSTDPGEPLRCLYWDGSYAITPLTSSAWIAPTLTNSWANLGSGFANAGYLKDPMGFVHLRGEVNGGINGSIIFTLPAGYRPAAATNLASINGASAFAYLQIAASGTVEAVNVSGALSLNVAPFLAEN